jgi:hypothetical protein
MPPKALSMYSRSNRVGSWDDIFNVALGGGSMPFITHSCPATSKALRNGTQLIGVVPATGAGVSPPGGRAAELVALDEALSGLAEVDGRKARVMELRYFGGLGVEEVAEV